MTRWYLSTLAGQFTRRSTELGSEKKPINPILGEQFLGFWKGDGDEGETRLWVEQVCHHPPITAYHLENEKAGVWFEGNCAQKVGFFLFFPCLAFPSFFFSFLHSARTYR